MHQSIYGSNRVKYYRKSPRNCRSRAIFDIHGSIKFVGTTNQLFVSSKDYLQAVSGKGLPGAWMFTPFKSSHKQSASSVVKASGTTTISNIASKFA